MKKIACLLPLVLWACSGNNTQQAPAADEYIVDCTTQSDAGTDVTSDENLDRFIEAEASGRVTDGTCNSPALTKPDPGARLSAQTPNLFSFNPNSCSPTGTNHRRTGLRNVPRQQPAYSRVIEAVLARVSTEAQAHCGAISGTNYYFKVMPQNGTTPLYTAMLSVASFTPDAAKWKKAMSGRNGQNVTVIIERAEFLKGDISQGPYRAQATFAVGP